MKKSFKRILLAVPALGSLSTGASFIVVSFTNNDSKNNSQKQKTAQVNKASNTNDKIFPVVQSSELYNFIKIKEGNAYFDDDMIANAINLIIHKIKTSDVEVGWSYAFKDNNKNHLYIFITIRYADFFHKDDDKCTYELFIR